VDAVEIRWYSGGGNRGTNDYVTLEKNGSIGVGFTLLDSWPTDRKYARIGRTADRLVIQPVAESGKGCLQLQRLQDSRRAARLSAGTALRGFELRVSESRRCQAVWKDGLLWVVLPAADGSNEASPQKPIVEKPQTPAPATTVAGRERTCGNCIKQQFRLCTNEYSPNRRKLVSLTDVCPQHFFETEKHSRPQGQPSPDNQPKPQRQGSRPRVKCPVSDHGGKTFLVSGAGIAPHDVHGVVYAADRGDHSHRCPGSWRKV
jgi:hypothetical protein